MLLFGEREEEELIWHIGEGGKGPGGVEGREAMNRM